MPQKMPGGQGTEGVGGRMLRHTPLCPRGGLRRAGFAKPPPPPLSITLLRFFHSIYHCLKLPSLFIFSLSSMGVEELLSGFFTFELCPAHSRCSEILVVLEMQTKRLLCFPSSEPALEMTWDPCPGPEDYMPQPGTFLRWLQGRLLVTTGVSTQAARRPPPPPHWVAGCPPPGHPTTPPHLPLANPIAPSSPRAWHSRRGHQLFLNSRYTPRILFCMRDLFHDKTVYNLFPQSAKK